MLATVTNRTPGIRGLFTVDRGIVALEPGASGLVDLADHPLHRAWAAERAITIVPLSDKDAKAARKRLDAETEARNGEVAAALAALPPAGGR